MYIDLVFSTCVVTVYNVLFKIHNFTMCLQLMFLDNFENMFEGLGLFKRPLTTYNNDILNSLINMSFICSFFIEV